MTLQLEPQDTSQTSQVSPYPLFDLTRAISSSRRLEDIYDAALSCLRDSLGITKASVLLFDPDRVMRFKAWLDLSPEYRAAVEGHTPWTPETVDPQPVLVADVRDEPSLTGLCGAIEAEGIRALAFFPLCVEERLIGKFMLYYPEPHELSREEILIAQTIAAHVAFALDRHGIRQERREWREHLEAMFRSTVVGIVELDLEGRFRLVNDRFCELVGRTREQLLGGMSTLDITHPDDAPETAAIVSAFPEARESAIEKRYVRPDGGVVWVSVSTSPVNDADGKVQGAIAIVSDITRRMAGEQAAQASERRYSDLMEALNVAVYTTDAEGHITYYNDAAVAAWGRRPELGVDMWCGSWQIFTPEGQNVPLDECPMAITLKEDRPVRGIELLVEREDGTRLNVLPHPTPLHDADGKLVGAINVFVDITQRKQIELQLRERNQLTQSITDNMSVGLFLLDRDGAVEMMNPAAEHITGVRFEDAHGRGLHDAVHRLHEDGTPFHRDDCAIDCAARDMQALAGHEDVFVRPDGTFYNVVCNVAPLLKDGVRVGSVLDVRDATVEKQAEQALRESEETLRSAAQLKDHFLGLVSHELRTPISTILGNALLLLRRGDVIKPEDHKQALQDVASEADKLQDIIENLLLITRMEAGQLDFEPLAMPQLVEESLDDFRRFRPERNLRFTTAAGLRPALGESSLLPLIMRNLLSNADKYSDAGKPIEVSVRADAETGGVLVSVRDYGIGLDSADLDNVFEPFFRSTRSRVFAKGMGLGLAVCKRALEAQGGRIWVEQQPDEGLSFSFVLQPVPELDLVD